MSAGEVYITYNVLEQREVTDEAGNITVQSVPVQVTSDPQAVTFIKVQ